MTFDPKRVESIKRIRAATGLGLRESVDLYDKFAGNADKAIERFQHYREQSLLVGEFKSHLPVLGYFVSSEKEPRLNGFYPDINEPTLERVRRYDPEAQIIELVNKKEADQLIGIAGGT